MRSFRTVAVVLVLLAASVASAQCLTTLRTVSSTQPILPGPVAWSGRVLAVAGQETVTGSIFFATFDGSGVPLSPVTTVPSSAGFKVLDLEWNGTDFMLFLAEPDGDLLLRRISADGRLVGSPIQRVLRLAENDRLAIEWSAFHGSYLMARIATATRPGIWLATIDPRGRLEHELQIEDEAVDGPIRLAVAETGIAGVFFMDSRGLFVRYQAAFPDRLLGDPERVWRGGANLMVTANGNEFVLVRTAELNATRDAIEWKSIDTAGNDLVPEMRIAQIAKVANAKALSFSVSGEDEYALAYRDRVAASTDLELRLRRLDRAGNVISDTPFGTGARHDTFLSMENFVVNGPTFLTVAGLDTATGDKAMLITWCPLRVRIDAPRTVRPGESVTFEAIVEGGVPSYRYFWRGFGRQADTRSFAHTFTQPGTYTVSLEVKDGTSTLVVSTFTIDVVTESTNAPGRRRSVRK